MLKVQSANFTAGTVHTGKALLCSVSLNTNTTEDATQQLQVQSWQPWRYQEKKTAEQ